MSVLVALVTVIVVTLVLCYKWRLTYWKRRNVFTFPPSIPFGNAKEAFLRTKPLAFSFYDVYKEVKSRGLKYGGYYFFGVPFFLPVDIDLIRTIIVKDFYYFTDHSAVSINEKVDPLNGHLLAQRGAKWKALRTKLTPTFSSGKIKYMFQTLVDCTKDLPTVLEETQKNNGCIDIKDIFARYAMDVIGSCAFGIDCNCLKNPDTEFRKYGRKIFRTDKGKIIKRMLRTIMPRVFTFFKIALTDRDVQDFFINTVRETIEYRDKNNVERKDFMQLLMELRHQALKIDKFGGAENESNEVPSYYQNGLSLNEIAAQAFVFFGAGFETSSITLTFLMYEIAIQHDIQEKLRDEINRVLDKYDQEITYDGINEMAYLDKCVLETLRKYPPIPTLPRGCTKSYRIPETDLVIEKGTNVLISIYGIHHDPEFYPDPEKFDPERFSDENKRTRPSMTFLAFGEGPRICIGQRFGLLETKVGLVAMLKHFKFSLNPKTKCPLQFEANQILSVKGGIWVDIEKI